MLERQAQKKNGREAAPNGVIGHQYATRQAKKHERRMLFLSSSNIDLHIIVDGVIVFSFYLR